MVLGAIVKGVLKGGSKAGGKLLRPGMKLSSGLPKTLGKVVKMSKGAYAKHMGRLVKQTGLSEDTLLAIAKKGGGAAMSLGTSGAGIGLAVDHVTSAEIDEKLAKLKEDLRNGD